MVRQHLVSTGDYPVQIIQLFDTSTKHFHYVQIIDSYFTILKYRIFLAKISGPSI
jgi:hypothetical protein